MRKARILFIAGLTGFTGLAGLAVQKPVKSWNFDSDKPGEIASDFKSEVGEWKVTVDESAPSKPHVLAQLAKSDEQTFNVVLLKEPSAKDLDFQVKFRVVGGKVDQGGGVIWRAKDAKNYYLYRYNPLERNIRVYKVIDGVRTIIHSVEDVEEAPGWQTMRVVSRGKRLEGHLNGEARFSITNEAISNAGQVGLWSKADAQTHFDDLQLEVMDH